MENVIEREREVEMRYWEILKVEKRGNAKQK